MRGRKPDRQLVDGEWMTAKQLAALLGVSIKSISYHLCKYTGMSFQRLADKYRAGLVVVGGNPHAGGRAAAVHRVNGRDMTIRQAAERYGFTECALKNHMYRYGLSLQQAVRKMEMLRRRRAERKILKILKG